MPPFRDWNTKSEIKYFLQKGWIIETWRIVYLYLEPQVNCKPCQIAVKNIYILSSWPLLSLLLIEILFSPSRKAFNWTFCLVYITVTSSKLVPEWVWHKAKVLNCVRGGLHLVSWITLFFQDRQRWVSSIFSNVFCLYLRLLQGWLQLTLNCVYSSFVCLSLTSNWSE